MEDEHLFFSIPKHLDRGSTFCGLPQDEVIPALALFVCLLVTRHELVGFMLAATWFSILRGLKARHGDHFIPMMIYWFAPQCLVKTVFKKTPPSSQQYWLN